MAAYIMTEEEYQHHKKVAVSVPGLGLCSRLDNGLIKVEGYMPTDLKQLTALQKRTLINAALASGMHYSDEFFDSVLRHLGI